MSRDFEFMPTERELYGWGSKDPNPNNLPEHEKSEFPFVEDNQPDNVNGGLIFRDGKIVGASIALTKIDESLGVVQRKIITERNMYITIPDRKIIGVLSIESLGNPSWMEFKRIEEDLIKMHFGEGAWIMAGIHVTAGGWLSGPYSQHEELREVYTWEEIANREVIEHVPIEYLPHRGEMLKEQEREMEEFYDQMDEIESWRS